MAASRFRVGSTSRGGQASKFSERMNSDTTILPPNSSSASSSTGGGAWKAQWEAKVRASVVTDVVRGPADPKIVAAAAAIDADGGKSKSLPSSVHSSNATANVLADAAPRRRATASVTTDRASWEAQVRASFVSGVVRGPVDASCGRADAFDRAQLEAFAEEEDAESDGLGFTARRREISDKVERSETGIFEALEQIRNDLREMQEEDAAISSRLGQLRENIVDVDNHLEDLCCSGLSITPLPMDFEGTLSLTREDSRSSAQDSSSCEERSSQDGSGVFRDSANSPRSLPPVRPASSQASSASSTLSTDSGLGVRRHLSSGTDSDGEEEETDGCGDKIFNGSSSGNDFDSLNVGESRLRTASLLSGIHGEELMELYLRKEQSLRQELGLNESSQTLSEKNDDCGFIDDGEVCKQAANNPKRPLSHRSAKIFGFKMNAGKKPLGTQFEVKPLTNTTRTVNRAL